MSTGWGRFTAHRLTVAEGAGGLEQGPANEVEASQTVVSRSGPMNDLTEAFLEAERGNLLAGIARKCGAMIRRD